MPQNQKRYWLFQFCGWSALILLYTFFYFTLKIKEQHHFFISAFLVAIEGIIVTHVMRAVIKEMKLLQRKLNEQIAWMFALTVFFSIVFATIGILVDSIFNFTLDAYKDYSFTEKLIRESFGCFFYIIIWNLIYFIYHYVTRAQKDQVDKIRLEALVKELELKTIKAHINPHFIFNALNSIRALVDENPNRARTAITGLSNILRSSMTTDKVETVSLEKELDIVNDYLALEQIRFEERLVVNMDIDEDTLGQQVPTMMLQTLVENAIKHGISKNISGGTIDLISDFKNAHHEIIIRNTGHLNGSSANVGFGIDSTKNRLNLLYGNKASFEIKDINTNQVEAKLILPVTI